ncbi:hypothetical protein KY317_00785 [Candidatus Woesearchaeota archaeon]|nr:hypothetical protein [Candidatus Woesearchaeota archaeon]
MKQKIILGILIISILIISGCSGTLPVEETAEEKALSEEAQTTKDLIEELSEKEGLIEGEETAEGEKLPEKKDYTITIDMFTGDPEDLTIAVGSSVTWINNHPTFIHLIAVRERLDGNYGESLTEKNKIYGNQTFTYMFEEPGTYQWYSSTRYPASSGTIEVKYGEEGLSVQ